jgi:hypothetical protein
LNEEIFTLDKKITKANRVLDTFKIYNLEKVESLGQKRKFYTTGKTTHKQQKRKGRERDLNPQ